MLRANKRTEPFLAAAYHPQMDIRTITKNKEACKKPLSESLQIDVGSGVLANGPTFVAWLKASIEACDAHTWNRYGSICSEATSASQESAKL